MTMAYHFPRRPCALAPGFLEGLTGQVGELADGPCEACRERGDVRGRLHVLWRPPA